MKMQNIVKAIGEIEPWVTSVERKYKMDLGAFVLDFINANTAQLEQHLADKPFLARELKEPWINNDQTTPGLGMLLGNLAGASNVPKALSWLETVGVDFSLVRLKNFATNPLSSAIYADHPGGTLDVLKWFHERHGDVLFREPMSDGRTLLTTMLGLARIEPVMWMLHQDESLFDEPVLTGDSKSPTSWSLVDYAAVAVQGNSPLKDMIRTMAAANQARSALREIDADRVGISP